MISPLVGNPLVERTHAVHVPTVSLCCAIVWAARDLAAENEGIPPGERENVAAVLDAVASELAALTDDDRAGAVVPAPAIPTLPDTSEAARAKGYTGDCCSDCGNMTMVRNGTCLKCETCGSTTGCS